MGLRERGLQRSVRNIHLQINCVMLETVFQMRTGQNEEWRREPRQFAECWKSGDRFAGFLSSALPFIQLRVSIKKCLK